MEIHIKANFLAWLAKIALPVLIFLAAIYGARSMIANPPEVDRRQPPASAELFVNVLPMQPQDYQVRVKSFGAVEARTRSRLAARVGSEVTFTAPQLRAGGRFNKGEVLLRLDATDYQLNIKSSEAALAQAEATLAEEQARSEQALSDWQRLGRNQPASALVLRQPQLMAAEANLASAQAQLERARIDLQRTEIRAPFAGITVDKFVEIGEQISAGSQLADIHTSDAARVRLPVTQQLFDFIDEFIGSSASEVIFTDSISGQSWRGSLVYSENSVDEQTRQLVAVAEIDDGWRQGLYLGQYLQADIKGQLLTSVFVIPRSVLRSDGKVFVLEDGSLNERQVNLLWEDDNNAVVTAGLEAGDLLVLDALGSVVPGTKARARTGHGSADSKAATESNTL